MTSTFWLSSKQGVPIEIFATSKNAPPPAASLHFVIFMSTRIHHFLFARESSENLQIFYFPNMCRAVCEPDRDVCVGCKRNAQPR